ncbi:unnamed protein product [Vicia faba]|uniref:DUF2828 domain-containing protein n=1 Tax=Vicia faba TaxID=3906 RepID=A0AAV0YXM6_VICFA|nr:unnamed protein product [Vicia faba]
MAAATLIGPPEIYTLKSNPNPTTTTSTQTVTTNDGFIDQMVANFKSIGSNRQPPMGLTENMSPTFLSTGNPCLDFFFHVVPDTPSETLVERLQLAWSHNPLTTLKLVCNLHGVRGTGKSDREGFYAAALWFHQHHPKTLASNVPSLADFGYFKDLPEILYRLLEGSQIRKTQKQEWTQRKFGSKNKCSSAPFGQRKTKKKQSKNNDGDNKGWKGTAKDSLMSEEMVARAKAEKQTAHALKEEEEEALERRGPVTTTTRKMNPTTKKMTPLKVVLKINLNRLV